MKLYEIITKGIDYLKNGKLELADVEFMTAYSYEDTTRKVLFDEIWPWVENKSSSIDYFERIELYEALIDYLAFTQPLEFYDFLLFQLHCNETMLNLRSGQYREAQHKFVILYNNSVQFNPVITDVRSSLLYKNNGEISIQIFDGPILNYYLGLVNFLTDNYEEALNFYETANELLGSNSHPHDKFSVYNSLGVTNVALNNFEEAYVEYNRALNVATNCNNKSEIATVFINYANLCVIQYDFRSANQYADLSLNLARNFSEINFASLQIKITSFLVKSKILIYQEHLQEAIILLEEALSISMKTNNPEWLSVFLHHLITQYISCNDFQSASQKLFELQQLVNNHQTPSIQIKSLISQVEYNLALNNSSATLIEDLFDILEVQSINSVDRNSAIIHLIHQELSNSNIDIYGKLLHQDLINEMTEDPYILAFHLFKLISMSGGIISPEDVFGGLEELEDILSDISSENYPKAFATFVSLIKMYEITPSVVSKLKTTLLAIFNDIIPNQIYQIELMH